MGASEGFRALFAHFAEQYLADFETARPLRNSGMRLAQPSAPHMRRRSSYSSGPMLAMLFSCR